MNKTIVNTRATHQAKALDALILKYGATPLAYPCIDIIPPADSSELDQGIRDLIAGKFDWLVLTSANTVYSLAQRLSALGLRLPSTFKTAVIGTATAEAAQTMLGLHIDLIPAEQVAESLAVALLDQSARRVFLPESAIARPTLAQALPDVHTVTAYETVCGSGGIIFKDQPVDVVTFTSSSTVTCFIQRLEAEGTSPLSADVCVACIGQKTANTAREHGLSVTITPQEYTLDAMMAAISQYFE